MNRDPRVEPARKAAWATAAIIEAFGILYAFAFVMKYDMKDPIVVFVMLAVAVAGAWVTRRWLWGLINDELFHKIDSRR